MSARTHRAKDIIKKYGAKGLGAYMRGGLAGAFITASLGLTAVSWHALGRSHSHSLAFLSALMILPTATTGVYHLAKAWRCGTEERCLKLSPHLKLSPLHALILWSAAKRGLYVGGLFIATLALLERTRTENPQQERPASVEALTPAAGALRGNLEPARLTHATACKLIRAKDF